MNRITSLFGIDYPVIAGGMAWCSGWRLAAAVSNAGGLGLIGAGSMTPELLKEHIEKCQAATVKPFGVNVPLMKPGAEEMMHIIAETGVKVVFYLCWQPEEVDWLAQRTWYHGSACGVFVQVCQEV